MTHDPALVEAVARGLCRQHSHDPDARGLHSRGLTANWLAFVPEATAALDAIEAQGFVVVPREPDPEMCIKGGLAAAQENPIAETWVDTAAACYRAMIAARPGAQP